MDNVGIVVDDLAAAIAFFVELEMELEARRRSRDGGWTAASGSTASSATSPCCGPLTATAGWS
jgi:catechol 2,3-dioxygenase-like lactoylglutathione lyase family enzyme